MRIRGEIRQEFRKLYADVDVLLAPSRYTPAPKLTEALDQEPASKPSSPGMNMLIRIGNLTGLPAISLPCGFAGKLPVGIQLVSTAFSENLLIAIGRQYQSKTDWHSRRPS